MKYRLIVAVACGLIMSGAAQSAEITVLSSGAMREIVTELLPQFEKSSGHKVTITWSGTAKIKTQIGGGETYDLVIVTAPAIDAFIKDGKLRSSSRVDLVRSGVGVAVKAGAPKPDIGSAAAVKSALLAAKSVAYSTGPSGVYVQALFGKLGIADQMKAKSKQTVSGTRVGEYLARGDAELGFPAGRRANPRKRHRFPRTAAARNPKHHRFLKRCSCRREAAGCRQGIAGLPGRASSCRRG